MRFRILGDFSVVAVLIWMLGLDPLLVSLMFASRLLLTCSLRTSSRDTCGSGWTDMASHWDVQLLIAAFIMTFCMMMIDSCGLSFHMSRVCFDNHQMWVP